MRVWASERASECARKRYTEIDREIQHLRASATRPFAFSMAAAAGEGAAEEEEKEEEAVEMLAAD